MEISTLFGLPAHPLIVHAVVVLVPLVALGALAMVLRGSIRARIGVLVAAGAILTLILTVLAGGSGEALEEQVAETPVLEEHTELGEQLLPWVAILAIAAIGYLWLTRHKASRAAADAGDTPAGRRRGRAVTAPVTLVLAGVVVASAVGSIALVARIGHSGARSVWSDVGNRPADSPITEPKAETDGQRGVGGTSGPVTEVAAGGRSGEPSAT